MSLTKHAADYHKQRLREARLLFPPPAKFSQNDLFVTLGISNPAKWLARWIAEGQAARAQTASARERSKGKANLYRFL